MLLLLLFHFLGFLWFFFTFLQMFINKDIWIFHNVHIVFFLYFFCCFSFCCFSFCCFSFCCFSFCFLALDFGFAFASASANSFSIADIELASASALNQLQLLHVILLCISNYVVLFLIYIHNKDTKVLPI